MFLVLYVFLNFCLKQLTHVLEHEFLEEQVSSIRELAGFVTRLRSFKTNYALGEYMFDQKLQ